MTRCEAAWIESWDDVVECCADAAGIDPTVQESIIEQVSDLLFNLSWQQFPGICSVTARPCAPCRCRRRCCCEPTEQVDLTAGGNPWPVISVDEVLVDGVPLDASAYRLDDHRWLVRLDGKRWPRCANMDLPTTEPGTWEVTWSYGVEVPPGGQAAARTFACELAKACLGKDCDLPSSVTSITREGVTMMVQNPMSFLADGRTGIYTVDLWLMSVNPTRTRPTPGIADPSAPRPIIETVEPLS